MSDKRYCYGVRLDGSWSPSLYVWATDAASAMRVARQTGLNVTGAREIVPWFAWELTFGRLHLMEHLRDELVLYGAGEGFYHRYRGQVYGMDVSGAFLPVWMGRPLAF